MKKASAINFLKNNLRYAAVFVIFLTVIFFGYSDRGFIQNNECNDPHRLEKTSVVIPEIRAKDQYYRIINFLNTANSDYYRLTFNIRANQNSEVAVHMASASGKEADIASFSVEESVYDAAKEFIFSTDGFYKDLLFEKKGNSDAKVYIHNVNLSRLKVKSEQELELLHPTILGDTEIKESGVSQAKEKGDHFSQLKNSKTRIGQIFMADSDYLAGVSFDLQVKGDSEEKYRLELREASEKKGVFHINNEILATLEFASGYIERYRRGDNGLFFPLTSRLEKGKFYFVGIDNSAVRNNFFNYLEIKGTNDKNASPDSIGVVWRSREVAEIGDLFFTVNTAKFSDVQGERVLTGAKVEDLGNGDGVYSYRAGGKPTDILDLFSYSRGKVWFNDYESIVSGSPRDNAAYVYRFYSPFVFNKIRIAAEQMYAEWYRVVIAYSFDNQNWTELPYFGEGRIDSPQKFDSIVTTDETRKEIYIKITYDNDDSKEIKLFGLRNFNVTGEVEIK